MSDASRSWTITGHLRLSLIERHIVEIEPCMISEPVPPYLSRLYEPTEEVL